MARKKTTPDEAAPPFEEAIAELEAIVASMEEEHLPLEELVAKYEKGTKLLGRCESVLASAKKRLQTIAAKSNPVEADEESHDQSDRLTHDPASSPDDHDDIRLF